MITFGPDIETTGLNPYNNKLITVQFRRGGKNYMWKEWELGEKGAIFGFLEEWRKIPRSIRVGGDFFVVFNLKFDLPFLLERAMKLGIQKMPGWNEYYLWQNVVHGPSFIDLYQLLGDQLMNFAKWRNCLIGTFGVYENKQIPEFYKNRKFDEIERYVNDELVSLERVYNEVIREDFYAKLQELRKRANAEYRRL